MTINIVHILMICAEYISYLHIDYISEIAGQIYVRIRSKMRSWISQSDFVIENIQ